MSAIQPVKDSLAATLSYLALLFGVCWAGTLLLALGPGHEGFGGLAVAGAFGGAVAPWCAGAAVAFVSGRAGRPVALIISVAAVGVLWLAPRF